MHKINLSLLLMVTYCFPVTIRNGAEASQQRVDEVWHVIKQLKELSVGVGGDYYWLYRICKDCKEDYRENTACTIDNSMYSNRISPEGKVLIKERIMQDNVITEEDQNIILSSYCGSADPKLVRACYPVPKSIFQKCLELLHLLK